MGLHAYGHLTETQRWNREARAADAQAQRWQREEATAAAAQREMPDRDPGALCLPTDPSGRGSLDEQLARQEKDLLVAALHRAAGVKKKAAALLGINYRSLRHRLQKYGLDVRGETAFRHRDADAMPGEVQN